MVPVVHLEAVKREKYLLLPAILPRFRDRTARGVVTVLTELRFLSANRVFLNWIYSLCVTHLSAIFLGIIQHLVKKSNNIKFAAVKN